MCLSIYYNTAQYYITKGSHAKIYFYYYSNVIALHLLFFDRFDVHLNIGLKLRTLKTYENLLKLRNDDTSPNFFNFKRI